jgi:hypothetical protein
MTAEYVLSRDYPPRVILRGSVNGTARNFSTGGTPLVVNMRRGRCGFKQCDLTRAVKGVRKADVEVERVEIHKDGKIIVIAGKPAEATSERNELDDWMDHGHVSDVATLGDSGHLRRDGGHP